MGRAAFDDLVSMYAGEGRYYHTLSHISTCMEALHPYRNRPDWPGLATALLWHDAVYVAGSDSNEYDSAILAAHYLRVFEFPVDDYGIERLIMSTKHHEPDQEDEALVCSIDMLMLASDWETYLLDNANIRNEYQQFSDEEWEFGRLAFLESVESPFQHPDFKHLNAPAKANMQREIELIEKAMDARKR